LEPQWVGTVKRAYLKDPRNIYRADEPNDIRFTHLFVARRFGAPPEEDSKPQLKITRSRSGSDGHLKTMIAGETPAFMRNLPNVESVAKATNLAMLTNLFGPPHGPSCAWGFGDTMHSTAGWTCFTLEATNRLRFLGVSASLSSTRHATTGQVDRLHVTEGYFRPANPKSRDEVAKYKTGEDDFAEDERKKAEARAKFPQALRSFVEARETPDDPDLKAYKRALISVRAKPDPALFRQLVEAMHEDTVTFKGYLEDILFDHWLKVAPWESEQNKVAIRALADAIPHAASKYALQDALIVFLRTQGGGEFTTAGIEVRPDGNYILSGGKPPTDVSKASAEMYQEIKQRYPHLWSD